VLQLVGGDIIRLGDTVQDWLPGQVPGSSEITVRHLLGHTSGLRDYTDDLSDAAVVLRDRLVRRSPDELVASAVCRAPLFAPGTSRSSCNTGYILLGMIIERAAGDSYGAASPGIDAGLGIGRALLPDGIAMWGSTGGFFGFRTWSSHNSVRRPSAHRLRDHRPRPVAVHPRPPADVFCPQPGPLRPATLAAGSESFLG
jgi:hypothetical protein